MADENNFEQLLEEYLYEFGRGDIVKGMVVNVGKDGVSVDIGAKSTAFMPSEECLETPEEGAICDFVIIGDEDENGKFTVSAKRVERAYMLEFLDNQRRQNEIVEGVVTAVVKGGVTVDVGGVKGFIPLSEYRSKTGENKPGDSIRVKVLNVDKKSGDLILSNKDVGREEAEAAIQKAFDELEEGMVKDGTVVRITDFGAFVDIGGIDGLLPLSQISSKWVEHPGDVLKNGDKVTVKIIGKDDKKRRLSLSTKALEPRIEEISGKKLEEGEKFGVIVTKIKPFGTLCEIDGKIEGLIPRGEIKRLQNKGKCGYNVGEEVCVRVSKIGADGRITFKIEELDDNGE